MGDIKFRIILTNISKTITLQTSKYKMLELNNVCIYLQYLVRVIYWAYTTFLADIFRYLNHIILIIFNPKIFIVEKKTTIYVTN